MRILTEQDIEKVYSPGNKTSSYEKSLSFYQFLENNEGVLLENIIGITLSDVLYSKYYWFLMLKKENERINGTDAGYDQLAHKLLVSIYEYSGVHFDANEYAESIRIIENLVYE